MSKIIVLAEQQLGKLSNATYNAIGAAKKLAGIVGGEFDIALVGGVIEGTIKDVAGYGAAKVYTATDATLERYTAQAYAQAYASVIKAAGAEFVVMAGTAIGKDVAPRVAARLEAGQASDIVDILDGPIYLRPMWAGNVYGKVKINTDIQVMTIRPTDFEAAQATGGESPVEAVEAGVDAGALRMEFVKLDIVESDRPPLTEASVIISGGRGLKSKEKFAEIIEPLADHFGAAIGATRAVVDAGWVPNDWQVGQTGKVVAPDLYFAIGISGAIQHLAGMKSSKVIVAINKDEEAPIFQVADYGIVGDLFEVVPELLSKLK
ncbi:electron transfer flavoprotein subunit alpha/FixB family protein [Myxococcota bacterium]|nr:electron transfer flavoprotein subunit alpha/FixB family protein [Myxococcota bacterium]MBU1432965.1 electron transfer flavoprotein subunit alpha/FixB family protein [Myxococcota bacterium]MBU1896319.1 electron transfer flavoprotein subunit alpha/FixB family protein [Myxococcota bacterium]